MSLSLYCCVVFILSLYITVGVGWNGVGGWGEGSRGVGWGVGWGQGVNTVSFPVKGSPTCYSHTYMYRKFVIAIHICIDIH